MTIVYVLKAAYNTTNTFSKVYWSKFSVLRNQTPIIFPLPRAVINYCDNFRASHR